MVLVAMFDSYFLTLPWNVSSFLSLQALTYPHFQDVCSEAQRMSYLDAGLQDPAGAAAFNPLV